MRDDSDGAEPRFIARDRLTVGGIIAPMTSYHESRIDTVTVHRRGAVVSRRVELPATPVGSQPIEPIRIGPLPLSIDDASVRVSVDSDGSLHATELKVVLDAPDADESLRPARPEDLEAARLKTRRLTDALDSIDRERTRMESLPAVARPNSEVGVEPPPSPAESRIALLSLRDTRLREGDERRRKVAKELRDAKRALTDLLEREVRATSMRRTEPGELRKAIEVSLHGEMGEGPATVRVEYRVDAARWAPTYALRLDPLMSVGTVEVRAMVAQRSGEDWNGVTLTLSTASLEGWAELPELPSIRIGRRQARPSKSGWRPPPAGTDALFSDFDQEQGRWSAASAHTAKMRPARMRAKAKGMRATAPSGGMPEAMPMPGSMPTGAPPARAPARRDERIASELPAQQSRARAAAAPAMPPGPPLGMAQKKSSGLGATLGNAVDALAGSFADGALEPMESMESEFFALDEPAEETVDTAMLDYGRLRMPAPNTSGRGKLTLRTRRQLYVERIEEMEVEVDLTAALGLIDRGSNKVHGAPLPTGCHAPSVSGFDYVYRAGGRLDAPSDGVFHNLALLSCEAEARARFVVVPRESRDAFRFVEMDNPLDSPLLNGPIDVFVGGDFLMTSELDEVPENGVLRLGLGVEQRLKVSRNARFSEKSGGLMGGKLDLLHDVEVELENLLPRPAEVEVRERLPVLREQEDDIRLEPGEVSPPWTEWEPDEQPDLEGGHRWQLVIPPGEKQTLRAAYSIRIASKHEIVGGNRREA